MREGIARAPSGHDLLLVEDDPEDALVIRELLSRATGPERPLQHVVCLKDAVSALRSRTFEAVLLDLRLPDGAGVECVGAVLEACEVPIVVLTGFDDEDLALSCLAVGAQDYLSKGEVESRSLVRSVNYACARSRERAQRRRADGLQARLASIVEVSTDGILSVDLEGFVVTWNHGAARILGYSVAEVVGRPLSEFVRVDGAGDEEAPWQNRLPTDRGPWGESAFEAVWLTRDDTPITVSVVTCALPGPNGAGGMAAVFRDVTATRQRDRELRDTNVALLQRDRQMRALTARLNATREEERTRISRQVHDELGQLLTGIKMDLRWAARRLPRDQPSLAPIADRLLEAEGLLDQTVATVQRIAVELRPSALDALGLSAALRDEARRFQHHSGLSVGVLISAQAEPPLEAGIELFRIVQELLTNVARHANASHVDVRLSEQSEGWVLVVEDDGVGIVEPAARGASLGLLGMRERAEALGGSLEVARAGEAGTIATVQIPRAASRREDDAVRPDSG